MKRYLWLVQSYVAASLIPLLLSTGRNFEYEYLLLASYAILILTTINALAIPDNQIPQTNGKYAPYARLDAIWMLALGPLIFAAPAVLAFLTGACKCSTNGYFFWGVFQLAPAWILAHASYHFVLLMRVKGYTRFRICALYAILLPLILAYAAFRFWLGPQVHIYDLVLGYIHGPIYDAWIPVDDGLAWARATHLFIAFALLFAVLGWCERRRFFLAVLFFLLGLVCGVTSNFYPSVQIGHSALSSLLPEIKDHANFTLYYNADTEKQAKRLFGEAAFHTADLKSIFGDDVPKVKIYLYPNQTAKKLWFGAGDTDVTDVFTPSIHITPSNSPHPTLRHELVHAMSSPFAFHGLGFHPNMAFTEGLAVALAPEEGELSLHEGVAALYLSKRMPSVTKLFSPMFWQISGARTYTVAGSIIQYLIATYGIKSVMKLYSGGSWEESFGAKKIDILKRWRYFILKNFSNKDKAIVSEALFRYPGVLNDQCPHSKSDLAQQRQTSIYTRLRQPLGWNPDLDYNNWRLQLNPQDKIYIAKKFRTSLNDLVKGNIFEYSTIEELTKGIEENFIWPPETIDDVELGILLADTLKLTGNSLGDASWLKNLNDTAKKKTFDEGTTRAIQARTQINKLPKTDVMAWRRYLANASEIAPPQKPDEPWILTYLRLRNSKNNAYNLEALQSALELPTDKKLNPSFAIEYYKTLAQKLSELSAYNLAQQAIQNIVVAIPANRKEFFELELRRLRFQDLMSQ